MGTRINIKKSLFQEQVLQQTASIVSTTKRRLAFLDLLLESTDESGNSLSLSDIQEEVRTVVLNIFRIIYKKYNLQ